ncbi:hypothetical protein [Stratiformator vulcanicus]|uniref:Uncharacterized protein n=1 Tax=Stratiformator vulcanicus TaxID=2527980 RepID=A0A517R4L3_9PLAN|nr:hypothetical protein [Stratiformator vulcanicus]QDT38773.1 hypothetical protein Pan189_31710 [Stratiformator vulcanicus]
MAIPSDLRASLPQTDPVSGYIPFYDRHEMASDDNGFSAFDDIAQLRNFCA